MLVKEVTNQSDVSHKNQSENVLKTNLYRSKHLLNLNPDTDPGQATGKLYHLRLRVECTFFCNLQSWARTSPRFLCRLTALIILL